MLSPDILEGVVPKLVKAGLDSLPREACGLICPDGTVFYLTNEAESEQAYLVSREQLGTAFYGVDGVVDLGFGIEDVVIWHTHPSGFVGPSKGDLESRRQPILEKMAHLVVALPTGETSYF